MRILALLCLASVRLAHAAAGTACPSLATADSAATPFEWSSLPGLPAAPGGAYRIGVWGDSLTSARMFIDSALKASGIDPTAVRPSFIQAAIKVPGLAMPLKGACASNGWTTSYAYREKGGTPGYSQGMLSMSAGPGEFIAMDFRYPLPGTRLKGLDILYEKNRPDSSLLLGVAIDGHAEQLISLSRTSASVLRLSPREPMATVRIRVVSGQVRIHGFQPRYQGAFNIVLDSASVPGSQMRSWNYVDERLLPGGAGGAGRSDDYDLILLQYGTNEGAAPAFNGANYASELDATLAQVRKLHPRATCILIGPPDRGNANGDPMKYSNIHMQIATAQRAASARHGCGFWNWQRETGGPGTALRWARATPPFEQPDLTHMTAQGYQASGQLFSRFYPFPIPKPNVTSNATSNDEPTK